MFLTCNIYCYFAGAFSLFYKRLFICAAAIFTLMTINSLHDEPKSNKMQPSKVQRNTYITYLLNRSVAMQQFYAEFHKARGTMKEQNVQSDTNSGIVLHVSDADYFEKFTLTIPGAKTVFLKAQREDQEGFILNTHYLPTSNNCTVMEHNAIEHQAFVNRTGCSEVINGRMANATWDDIADFLLTNNRDFVVSNSILSYIHLIPNAIVDMEGDVTFGNNKVITKHCTTRLTTGIYNRICNLFSSPPLYDEVFSIAQAWGDTFYHSTMEGIPKLALYLPYLQDNPHVKIHANIEHQFLPLLGLDPSQVVSGRIKAKLLYQPPGTSCGKMSLLGGQLLSRALHYGSEKPRDLIVLIRRSHSRRLNNHDAIHTMIKTYAKQAGLDVVVFKDNPLPNLTSTADAFRRAVIVVAPHGAGQSNMLFCQPGTVLIEALCYNKNHNINLCYYSSSKILGFRYHAIVFEHRQCMDITADDVKTPLLRYLHLLNYKTK